LFYALGVLQHLSQGGFHRKWISFAAPAVYLESA
jgi:hypothetical protein